MARFGQRQHSRTTAVLAVALCLGSTLTAAPALAAPVAAPGELVLPAAPRAVPRATQILDAGTTGFLWAQEGDDRLLWTDYTTGTATALQQRLPTPVTYDIDTGYFRDAASFQPGWYGTGSDTVALYSAEPAPHVTLLQGAGTSGHSSEVPLAEGHSYQGTFGDTVLSRTGDDGGPQAFHLWRAGTAGETPVSGLPAGATEVTVEDGDARSVILHYRTDDPSDSWGHWGLVDLASGELTSLPDRPDPDNGWEVTGFRLGTDSVLRLRTGRGELDVFDRSDLSAEFRTVDIGFVSYEAAFGIVGSAVLSVERVSPGNDQYQGQPLWAIPSDGAQPDQTKVMDPAAHQLVQAPDGSVLVAGADHFVGMGDLDWGVYRVAQAADGSIQRRRLTAVEPVPAQIHGLALGSGILSTADNSTFYAPATVLGAYRSTWLTTPTADGRPSVEKTTVDGEVTGRDGSCSAGGTRCIRMFADGTGYHGRQEATESGLTMLYANGDDNWGPTLDTGEDTPWLTDLSGRYAVVDGASSGRQTIGAFRPGADGVVLQRRDRVAAAVWGSTLWSGAASGGVVTATRLPAGTAVETFTTGNGCTPSSLQAVGRWVYWTCVDYWGDEHGSGVYDRTTKTTAVAPAGEVLLGDGYLVEHVAGGGLKLVDLAGGMTSRTLVSGYDLGQDGGIGTLWTVDRFGGRVAYADPGQRVHLVPTGIAASALSVIDATVATGAANWSGTWWLSKPAAAWQVTFRDGSGAVIRTVSGSAARGLLRASWDGKDSAGRVMPDGTFTWTLTAQPADGQGAALTVAGPPIAPLSPLTATKKPSITGTVAVGSTVKAVVGAWTPAATSYAYRWSANGTTIKGAVSAAYPVAAAVLGKRLTVTVTAKRAGYPSGVATSAASAVVAKGKAPKATKRPSITGTAKVGRTVRAAAGTWSPKATSYRYEWRLNGKLISGATGATLKLKASMRNKKITVTVIARRTGFTDGKATSVAVTVRR